MSKISNLSIIFNHHREPNTLKFILNNWEKVKNQDKIHYVICDAGPKEDPIDLSIVENYNLNIKVLQLDEYKFFNQPLGKNVMVQECETEWVFMTDPDRFFPKSAIEQIFLLDLNSNAAYDFFDYNWDPIEEKIVSEFWHPNTFLLTKEYFNQIGGYNEEFCGNYGHDDTEIRRRMDIYRLPIATYHYHEKDLVFRNRDSKINENKLLNPNLKLKRNTGNYTLIHQQFYIPTL